MTQKVTHELCPDLLKTDQAGSSVECTNHHVQVMLGANIGIVNVNGRKLDRVSIVAPDSRGKDIVRYVDFDNNLVIPYMGAGRLSDLVMNVPKYQTTVYRYPLYTTVAAQLVESVRFLHSNQIAVLGIEPGTVVCSNPDCDEIMISDLSRATLASSPSPYASELMQESVRYITSENIIDGKEIKKPVDDKTVSLFKDYMSRRPDWDATTKVDWFSVGATFYYILSASRYAPDEVQKANVKELSEKIFKAFTDKVVLDQVKNDSKSADTLKKVRDNITEGLLLIDGLLVADRSKRITFDASPKGTERAGKATNSLRSGKALMSALEVDSAHGHKSSCSSFMESAVKNSKILNGLPIENKSKLPSFIQQIC